MLAAALLGSGGGGFVSGSVLFASAGTYNYELPFGIHSARISLLGAGGGGSAATAGSQGSSGGAGGSLRNWIVPVTGRDALIIVVGSGGIGGAGLGVYGNAGGSTSLTFVNTGGLFRATGGAGGTNNPALAVAGGQGLLPPYGSGTAVTGNSGDIGSLSNFGGLGADSQFGTGGARGFFGVNPGNATGNGASGGGAFGSLSLPQAGLLGGNGSAGRVLIEWGWKV